MPPRSWQCLFIWQFFLVYSFGFSNGSTRTCNFLDVCVQTEIMAGCFKVSHQSYIQFIVSYIYISQTTTRKESLILQPFICIYLFLADIKCFQNHLCLFGYSNVCFHTKLCSWKLVYRIKIKSQQMFNVHVSSARYSDSA